MELIIMFIIMVLLWRNVLKMARQRREEYAVYEEQERLRKEEELRRKAEEERKAYIFEQGIHHQDLETEMGYVPSWTMERFRKRGPLRTDYPPINIKTEETITRFGRPKTKNLTPHQQKKLKKQLMERYPDRYFIDDLRDWNSYEPPKRKKTVRNSSYSDDMMDMWRLERANESLREMNEEYDRRHHDCDYHDDHDDCDDDCGCDYDD